MRHGCYKFCPKVREQLRRAREGDEQESFERINVAGPSGNQRLNEDIDRRIASRSPGKREEYSSERKNGRKEKKERRKRFVGSKSEASYEDYGSCDQTCIGHSEKLEKMKDPAKQQAIDQYIINKAIGYFDGLCNCHYGCLVDQLGKDPFVRSTIASAILFAIGLNLCWALDGWKVTI